MNYIGDFIPGSVITLPFALTGTSGLAVTVTSATVKVFIVGTSSAISAGVTLLQTLQSSFPGTTVVQIDTSTDTVNYLAGKDYMLALTSGNGGLLGVQVGHFSLNNRSLKGQTSTAQIGVNVVTIQGVTAQTSIAAPNVNVVTVGGATAQTSLASNNSNIVTINGVAAVTSTAQFGVNVVTWLGDTPARLLNGTLVQGAVSGSVASVTGSVGSVTARVTANADQINGVATVTSLALGNVNVVSFNGTVVQTSLASGNVNASIIGITSTAQFGVNLVTWKGDDPARLINGTLVQASVSGAVASVTNRVTANTDQIAGITAPSSLAANNVNVVNVNGVAIQALSGFIQTSVMQWLGIAPNPLVGGKVDASVTAATSTAAFGVNVVTWLGDAPARLLNATLVQTAVSGAVASVTGAVGSVGGNVGGNVVGSVASVVGDVGGNLVGNVNGNVAGNVTGSVGSVVARVTANTDQIAGVATVTSLASAKVNVISVAGNAIQAASGFVQANIVEWLGVAPAPLVGNGLLQAVTSGPLGTVTVGDYAAGQDPATYVLVTPTNKISTDASGSVTAGALAPFAIGTGTFQAATFTTPLFAANYLTSALVDGTERDAQADAILDRPNAIETGVTLRQATRAIGASAAGTLSGAGTGQVNIWGVGSSTTRITAVTDQSGNRLGVVLNV